MRIEQVITAYETRYYANDGTVWKRESECRQYEELLTDASPLKKLKFFNSDGEPIDVFALKEIPAFCYLVLTEEPPYYDWKVVKAIIGSNKMLMILIVCQVIAVCGIMTGQMLIMV